MTTLTIAAGWLAFLAAGAFAVTTIIRSVARGLRVAKDRGIL